MATNPIKKNPNPIRKNPKSHLKAQKPAQILSMDAAVLEDEKDAGFEAFMKGDK